MITTLRTFLNGLIILSLLAVSPYSQAASVPQTEVFPPGSGSNSEEPYDFSKGNDSQRTAGQYELPVATFDYYGKKITLYSTDYAGLYVENSGRRWIFIPNGQTQADLVDKARRNDFSDWFKRGAFKLYDESNLKEVEQAKHLDKSSVEGIFVDQRGKEWMWIPDQVEPGEKPRMYLVRVDNMTAEEMLASFGHRASKDNAWVQGAKVYGPEQLKFSSALLLVQLTKCFAGGLKDLSIRASSATPTCVDDFVAHLMDPKGWISFYFFIVANRMATEGLMKVAAITMAGAKAGKSIPFVRSKIIPFIPFLGMAAGSLASSFVGNILNAPSWGQCAELMAEEGLGSLPCKEAFAHMVNMEFMGDFLGQTGAMITAAAASHITQLLLKGGADITKNTFANMFARGAKFAVDGDIKAIEYTAKFGIRAIKNIRLVKGAMSVVGGLAGFTFFVATEIGSYVIFLAWDEVIRAPFMKEYNGLTKGFDIKSGIETIDNAINETDKLNWEKPYLTEECTMPYRQRFITMPMADFAFEMYQRFTVKPTCVNISPFDVGIGKLKTAAKKYRETVLLTAMEESSANWKKKVSGYLNNYRMTKMLTEYIYQNKARQIQTNLDLWLVSVYYTRSWIEALDQEMPVANDFKQNVYAQFAEMEPLITQIGYAKTLKESESILDSIKLMSMVFTEKLKNLFYAKAESNKEKLKRLLIANKAYIVNHIENARYIDRLGIAYPPELTPLINKTYKDYNQVDFNLLDLEDRTSYIKEDNNDLINYMAGTFGPEALNEVLYEMFCKRGSENTDFNFGRFNMNTSDFGTAAQFKPPFFLKLSVEEQQTFFNQNCVDVYGYPSDTFEEKDYSKTWKFKDRAYPDPISLAIDADIPLRGGQTVDEGTAWWNAQALPTTMKFTKNAILAYQQIISDNLMPLIPQMTPFQLQVDATSRGKNIWGQDYVTYRIGDDAMFFHSTLSRSIQAQTEYVLDKIKQIAGNDPKIAVLAKAVSDSMAKLLLTYREITPMSEVKAQLDKLEGDFVHLKVDDNNAIELRLKEFDTAAINLVLPEKTQTSLLEAWQEIHDTTSNLYHELTGLWFDDMTEQLVTYKAGLKSEELGNISKEEYKKYIYFKLLHENVNDIVIDYLTLDLYKKLSLQPLLEITNPESL